YPHFGRVAEAGSPTLRPPWRQQRLRLRTPALRALILTVLVPLSPCHLVTLSSLHAEPLPDPLPLKRVQIPAERAPAAIQRSAPKRWVQMPRTEFEELVQRAAAGAEAGRKQPQLVEARYRAHLVDNALVGSGQWKVLHPGAGKGVLPLPSLNLA